MLACTEEKSFLYSFIYTYFLFVGSALCFPAVPLGFATLYDSGGFEILDLIPPTPLRPEDQILRGYLDAFFHGLARLINAVIEEDLQWLLEAVAATYSAIPDAHNLQSAFAPRPAPLGSLLPAGTPAPRPASPAPSG